MVWPPVITPSARSAADLADCDDLRSVISTALAAKPVDEAGLRRGVWTFVATERADGALPEDVIIALTELIDVAQLTPVSVQEARLRQVIRWCVEAYFGHLGGTVTSREADAVTRVARADSESMSAPVGKTRRPFIRSPRATSAELADEPTPFPLTNDAMPLETAFPDWRERLTRNLSRHSLGRWEPLTYVHEEPA